MTVVESVGWMEANQQRLATELARIRRRLEDAAGGVSAEEASGRLLIFDDTSFNSALDTLCARFGLSPFERDLLLLCAGVELESTFSTLCAAVQGDARLGHATFGLALSTLAEPHWSAVAPQSPLRQYHLIELHEGDGLTNRRLVIDERVLHYLLGVDAVDARLSALLRPAPLLEALPPSHQRAAEAVRVAWRSESTIIPIVQLVGNDTEGARAVAVSACADRDLRAWLVRPIDLPQDTAERDLLVRLMTRECLLTPTVLVVELGTEDVTPALHSFLEDVPCPIILTAARACETTRASSIVEVARPGPAEQRDLWREALGDHRLTEDQIERIAGHFSLSRGRLIAAVRDVRASGGRLSAESLWRACRLRTRGGLDQLAQRIDSSTGWGDLVLPTAQLQQLREIAEQLKHRATVHERWGFAAKGNRGLGISALFTGESGTGKTLAAEVIANELDLDLYRIDLASTVSKYIGETEKNLARIFDAAENAGAVLLFDEADALFGKRSEVKDSHDRYANIEVGYLLQRIESYNGLAVLTTNLKGLLDSAFMRRFRFVVQFPFPEPKLRAEIWRRVLPPPLPRVAAVDVERLARLNVAGGNIRNIALNAAFLAASDRGSLTMSHLLRASQLEFAKLDRTLTEAEIGGWA